MTEFIIKEQSDEVVVFQGDTATTPTEANGLRAVTVAELNAAVASASGAAIDARFFSTRAAASAAQAGITPNAKINDLTDTTTIEAYREAFGDTGTVFVDSPDGWYSLDLEQLAAFDVTTAGGVEMSILSVVRDVSAFSDLAALTADDVPINGYIQCLENGATYQRVASGGVLDYTGSGGLQFDVIGGDVRAYGATGDSVTDDTAAFVLAPYGTYVPTGVFRVDPAQVDISGFNGVGVLEYTTDDSQHKVGLSSKGTVWLSTGDEFDNGTGLVPQVTGDGAINIESGNLKFFCDLDGDGDYDADMWGAGNLYLAAESRTHIRSNIPEFGVPGLDEGRVVFGATDTANYIQSAKNFSGSVRKDLAIGDYNSTDWWMYFDQSAGGFCGFGVSDNQPVARVHVADTATTVAVFENESGPTSRIGFKGANQTGYTEVAVGADSSDRLVLRGTSTDIIKLGAATVQAGAAEIAIGSASFPFNQLVLKSPDGTAWQITVDNSGNLVTSAA